MSPGPNCANGGLVVESGRDIDDSGTLTPDELTSSSYVCQPPPPAPPASQLVDVVTVPPGANCANGGQAIETGVDSNHDGTLESEEVTSTAYVCTGSTLFAVIDAPAMACPNGGQAIETGPDLNENGQLDPSEIISTSYVCAGTNGQQPLICIDVEPEGANCASGGSAIHVGVDVNHDGQLEDAEVLHTSYLCNPSGFVQGDYFIEGYSDLVALDRVTTITGRLVIDSSDVSALVLPELQTIGGNLECWPGFGGHCEQLTAIVLPRLSTVGTSIVLDAPKLTWLDLSSMATAPLIEIHDTPLTELDLPALKTSQLLLAFDHALAAVNAPSLTSGTVYITDLTALVQLSMPQLVSANIRFSGARPSVITQNRPLMIT